MYEVIETKAISGDFYCRTLICKDLIVKNGSTIEAVAPNKRNSIKMDSFQNSISNIINLEEGINQILFCNIPKGFYALNWSITINSHNDNPPCTIRLGLSDKSTEFNSNFGLFEMNNVYINPSFSYSSSCFIDSNKYDNIYLNCYICDTSGEAFIEKAIITFTKIN
jgi:hypothetical protein